MNNTFPCNETLIVLKENEELNFNQRALTDSDLELGEILLKHIDKFPCSPKREYEVVRCIMELCRN